METDDDDRETLALAVELYLEQLAELQGQVKGKAPAGQQGSDWELAMDLCLSELAAYRQRVADRVMCASLDRAITQDADQICAAVAEDVQAAQDREMALRLCPPGTAAATGTGTKQQQPAVAELAASMQGLRVSSSSASSSSSPSPSSSSSKKDVVVKGESSSSSPILVYPGRLNGHNNTVMARAAAPPRTPCIACGDTFEASRIVRAPCGHHYCHACVEDLVRASLTDESLFPPRCCSQNLPVQKAAATTTFAFLPTTLLAEFEAKRDEFSTADRTYCHRTTCSAFLSRRKGHIRGTTGTCPRCSSRTCTACKAAAHDDGRTECQEDAATQAVLQLARENGWQRCRTCRRLVEINYGCNHMTCLCGAQFCYVCGERWKTCQCPQWDENRLLARAEAIVDRGARPPARADAVATAAAAEQQRERERERERRVQRERQNLVQNHECEHTSWRSRNGSHQCEECDDTLPYFIYECTRCRILACRRCRFNRLTR